MERKKQPRWAKKNIEYGKETTYVSSNGRKESRLAIKELGRLLVESVEGRLVTVKTHCTVVKFGSTEEVSF